MRPFASCGGGQRGWASRLSLCVVSAALAGGAGCVRVQPWQRGALVRPSMQAGFADEGFALSYRAKVLESRTAGGLPGSAPGGGCGCTQ